MNRELHGLRLAGSAAILPPHGEKLFFDGKEVGQVTSAVKSPELHAGIALGYVRREAGAVGTELTVGSPSSEDKALVSTLPFVTSQPA